MCIYQDAMTTFPPVLLGRQVKDLSAYHCLLLQDNPFISGGKINLQDCLELIYICSLSYPTRFDKLTDKDVKKWGKQNAYLLQGNEECITAKLDKLIEDIQAYLDSYLQFPRYWTKANGSSKGTGLQWAFKLAASVLASFNLSESDVWNMPINRLACYRASIAEDLGADVVSEEELEAVRSLD